MSIEVREDDIVLSQDTFQEPCPEGRHPAVCVDVFFAGEEEENWDRGPKLVKKIAFVWQVFPQTGERQPDGSPFLMDVKITASLNPGSRCRLMLEKWRGREFTKDEAAGFSLGTVKGAPCWMPVFHKIGGGFINAHIEDDMIRDEKGTERKFSKVEPCTNGTAAKLIEEAKAWIGSYSRATVIEKYKRMAEGKAAKANSQTSTPDPIPSNDNKSSWVPF